jgi:hypothetical protein
MRVMVLVKANKDSEAGVLPNTELLTEMGKFNEELTKAGIMLAGEGLYPSSKGVRIRFSGAEPMTLPGPFGATSPQSAKSRQSGGPGELVAGFWLWRVRSMDEAIEWAKRAPFAGGEEIEIRPIFEAEDFGANLTPELREQEERIRKEIEQREASTRKAS